jgi:hypothetical protein
VNKTQVVGLGVGVLLLGIISWLLVDVGIPTGATPVITFQNCKMQANDVNKTIKLVAHSSTEDRASFKSFDDSYEIDFSGASPFSDLTPAPPIPVNTTISTVPITSKVKGHCLISDHCYYSFTFKDTSHPEKNTPPGANGVCADPGVHITR